MPIYRVFVRISATFSVTRPTRISLRRLLIVDRVTYHSELPNKSFLYAWLKPESDADHQQIARVRFLVQTIPFCRIQSPVTSRISTPSLKLGLLVLTVVPPVSCGWTVVGPVPLTTNACALDRSTLSLSPKTNAWSTRQIQRRELW
jgi:hypothetical protein